MSLLLNAVLEGRSNLFLLGPLFVARERPYKCLLLTTEMSKKELKKLLKVRPVGPHDGILFLSYLPKIEI